MTVRCRFGMAPLLGLCTLALGAATARAEPPARAEGRVQSEDARVEILGRSVKVGERIDLPEGWMRVEEAGVEDQRTGSFSVVPAASLTPTAVALRTRAEPARAPAASPSAAAAPRTVLVTRPPLPCREQRAAYLTTLLRTNGIEVDSPDLVMEGLEGEGTGPALGFYWLAFQTDPFRPLAWSSDLRDRAAALARCMREARGQ